MNKMKGTLVACVVLTLGLLLLAGSYTDPNNVVIGPDTTIKLPDGKLPVDTDQGGGKRKPWFPWLRPGPSLTASIAEQTPDVQPPTAPEPMVDLLAVPSKYRPRNTVGTNGMGLCVFTSIQYAAWWQNEPGLRDFQAKMKREPGGGWPKKVDQMIAKYAPGVQYVHYEGPNPGIIELALKTGRLPCITWAAGSHMLCCVYLDATQAAIVDNNSPEKVQWYSREKFLSMWKHNGYGWVFVLLAPPPPPAPRADTVGPLPPRQPQPLAIKAGEEDEETAKGNGMVWTPPADISWRLCDRASNWGEVALALTNDSHKQHLTAIGTPEETRAAIEPLGVLKDRYHIQRYTPDAWELAPGFVARPGVSTLYLQDRTGKVLFRREGVIVAGELVAALRRSDPAYDPRKDPDGRPLPQPFVKVDWSRAKKFGEDNKQTLLLGGGVAAALYLMSRKQQQQLPQASPSAVTVAPPPTPSAPAPATQQPTPSVNLDDLASKILLAIEKRAAATTTTTTTTKKGE